MFSKAPVASAFLRILGRKTDTGGRIHSWVFYMYRIESVNISTWGLEESHWGSALSRTSVERRGMSWCLNLLMTNALHLYMRLFPVHTKPPFFCLLSCSNSIHRWSGCCSTALLLSVEACWMLCLLERTYQLMITGEPVSLHHISNALKKIVNFPTPCLWV